MKYSMDFKDDANEYQVEIFGRGEKGETISSEAAIDKEYSTTTEGTKEILKNTALKTLEAHLYEQALESLKEKTMLDSMLHNQYMEEVMNIINTSLEEVETLYKEIG